MKRSINLLHTCFLLLSLMGVTSAATVPEEPLPPGYSPLAVEYLPPMNTARADHSTMIIDGEPVVIGGHTDGFVPTPTAEYFSGGEWHQMNMTYPHDGGFAVSLSSGEILVGGGHSQSLGIGQTFTVEKYDPVAHTFTGFACLDVKRTFAHALEINDTTVVVTGNWYHNDTIEIFNGSRQLVSAKGVACNRARPYILRCAPNDVLIVAGNDNHGKSVDTTLVDRLYGDAFDVPLLHDWHILKTLYDWDCNVSFIGDMSAGVYSHLLPVYNRAGEIGIMRVDSTSFSLLPTELPIPDVGLNGSPIAYISPIIADRDAECAYLVGHDADSRYYVISVWYNKPAPVPITIHFTEPIDKFGESMPVLMPTGDLMMAGGIIDNNYEPVNTVVVLKLGTPVRSNATSWSWWLLWAVIGIALCLVGWRLWRNRLPDNTVVKQEVDARGIAAADTAVEKPAFDNDILIGFEQLMKEGKLYLNSELKIGDVAAELGVEARELSQTVSSHYGCSFSQHINRLRVEYAKRLLLEHPEQKLTAIGEASGFSNDTNFFRIFKAITGSTPREWQSR